MFESGENSTLPQAYCTLLQFPTLTDNIYKSSFCGFSTFGLEQTSNIPQECRLTACFNRPRHASTFRSVNNNTKPKTAWRKTRILHQKELYTTIYSYLQLGCDIYRYLYVLDKKKKKKTVNLRSWNGFHCLQSEPSWAEIVVFPTHEFCMKLRDNRSACSFSIFGISEVRIELNRGKIAFLKVSAYQNTAFWLVKPIICGWVNGFHVFHCCCCYCSQLERYLTVYTCGAYEPGHAI